MIYIHINKTNNLLQYIEFTNYIYYKKYGQINKCRSFVKTFNRLIQTCKPKKAR